MINKDYMINGFNAVDQTFNSNDELMRRLSLLEEQVSYIQNNAILPYVQGRLVTNRAIPSSSTDVLPNDLVYDRIISTTYEYILVNNSGTLEWVRLSVSTF